MKNQSLKIGLLSALAMSCLIGVGTMMRHEVRFHANEAVGENGTYSLTLNSETSVVDGTVKTNLGNNIHLGASEGALFDNDSFVTLPTSSKVYSSSTGFEVIKSLQVFYEGSSLAYQLSKTSGDDTSLTTFDSGTKVYMLNQYQHFTLKNVGNSEAKVTKIVVEYYCGGSIEGNVYNYTVGNASYWDITTDENGVTTIVSNYDPADENHNLAAFMTLKGVRMGIGTVAYDMDFSPQSPTTLGNLKGFATNVYSESTRYGGDYISSGVLSSTNESVTDGRVLTYGFNPTGATKAVGWTHKSADGASVTNPASTLNGTLFNTNEKHRIITEVENSITKGKVVTNYMETAGGLNTKSVTNVDLSAFTGKCVGLQLHHKGISVSNVVITSLDEVDTIDRATSDTVAVMPTTGTGTAEDPFLIESVANFMWFKEEVATNTSYCAKLMKDLDLGHTGDYTSMCPSTAPYKGTFDGNGHKITGVSNFFAPTLTSFFGYATGATIKNLSLSVIFESTADKIAGFGITLVNTTITNCSLRGFVSGSGTGGGVGGIACFLDAGTSLISNCVNYASICNKAASGNTFAAGIIAGWVQANVGKVTNCKNYGCIYAKGNFVGGIVGLARVGTANKVDGCKNFGDISGITGTSAQVSGIVGRCRVAISNCMTFKDCLINGALASTLPRGDKTIKTLGYICNLETAALFGTGNSLCDINGNPIA